MEVSAKEGRKKGGRVRREERRVLFVLLHGLRAVERTCLLRACVNQQLAGPREERGMDGERGRGRGCPGREMEPNSQMAQDGVRRPFKVGLT